MRIFVMRLFCKACLIRTRREDPRLQAREEAPLLFSVCFHFSRKEKEEVPMSVVGRCEPIRQEPNRLKATGLREQPCLTSLSANYVG
jgi:hypothetical protein